MFKRYKRELIKDLEILLRKERGTFFKIKFLIQSNLNDLCIISSSYLIKHASQFASSLNKKIIKIIFARRLKERLEISKETFPCYYKIRIFSKSVEDVVLSKRFLHFPLNILTVLSRSCRYPLVTFNHAIAVWHEDPIKHIAAPCLRSLVSTCVQRGEKLNCENSLEGMNYHLHSGNFRIGVSPILAC